VKNGVAASGAVYYRPASAARGLLRMVRGPSWRPTG